MVWGLQNELTENTKGSNPMNTKDVLLVYYSRTGITRNIADRIAETMECDLEEICEKNRLEGPFGYVRAAVQALFDSAPLIEQAKHDPRKYKLVIVGSPVWMNKISSPIKTYLLKYGEQIKSTSLFLTHDGNKHREALKHFSNLTTKHPIAFLSIKTKEIDKDFTINRVKAFCDKISSLLGTEAKRSQIIRTVREAS